MPFHPIPASTSLLPSASSAFEILLPSTSGLQALFLPSRVTFLLYFTLFLKIEFFSSPFPPAISQTMLLCDSLLISFVSVQEVSSATFLWHHTHPFFSLLLISMSLSLFYSFSFKMFPTQNYLYSCNQCPPAPIHGPKRAGGKKTPWALFCTERKEEAWRNNQKAINLSFHKCLSRTCCI